MQAGVDPPSRYRHRNNTRFIRQEWVPLWDEEEPPGGFRPIRRIKNAASVYNEETWPPSGFPERKQINKTHSKTVFLLTDNDLLDLAYINGPPYMGRFSKLYCYVEVERRAWEKYGGPEGYNVAKKAAKEKKKAKKSAARGQAPAVQKLQRPAAPRGPENPKGTTRRGRLPLAGGPQPRNPQPGAPRLRSSTPEWEELQQDDEEPFPFLPARQSPFPTPDLDITSPPTSSPGPSTPVRSPKNKTIHQSQSKVIGHIDLTQDESDDDFVFVSRRRRTEGPPEYRRNKGPSVTENKNVIEISD
ncbi:hypothetical protein GALMADRAFT_158803 [Galerina marginata CBS 339.88]|uniref:Uncharacterized protein n=1 Tax=Galerina marginata (strain CBS 339.88) TaxID=685588 RepID=A0A067T0Q8_GALM3|nr:hypothetical protein GALMADRAFT_158803 [Galerina marginata CBS 339.88]